MLKVGSLFSGAGLCDLGLAWAGLEHQWFCEIDPFCRAILARHWPHTPIYNDVCGLKGTDLPWADVLCSGFPCQDVSSAGSRAGIKRGTRSGLWYEYARLIGEIRPRYVIIENVRGLLARGIEIVLQDLAALEYDAEWEVLPAAALASAVATQEATDEDSNWVMRSSVNAIAVAIRKPLTRQRLARRPAPSGAGFYCCLPPRSLA